LTDPRKQRFSAYLRRLADALKLSDWRVEIDDRPPDSGRATAEVECVYGRRYAVVRLSERFLEQPPDEQRNSLVHELIHCHLNPAAAMALDEMGDGGAGHFRRMLEYAVDGLADAIAPHMPPIDDKGEEGRAIPTVKGYSRKAIGANIKAELKSGRAKSQKQAVAIALNIARKAAKSAGKPSAGPKAPKRRKGKKSK
jgi:hypothetical protein